MRYEEYEYIETIYEQCEEIKRGKSMTQEERDREDFIGLIMGVVGIAITGFIIFWFIHH